MFGDKSSPLLHLITLPVKYIFIIYIRALLLVTSCCILLLRAQHCSGSACHFSAFRGTARADHRAVMDENHLGQDQGIG